MKVPPFKSKLTNPSLTITGAVTSGRYTEACTAMLSGIGVNSALLKASRMPLPVLMIMKEFDLFVAKFW